MSKGDNFANGALVTRAGNAKKSSEELNGISESAQEQHEMELQALFDQLELEEGEEVQFPYLVRGAEPGVRLGATGDRGIGGLR